MSSPLASSSNKRPRTSSPAHEAANPNPAPREPNYHEDFPKTDSSDLIIESSTGIHFGIARLFLQAASTVFRDTLIVGVDDACEKVDGLPIIKLEADEVDLARFLCFVHLSDDFHPLGIETLPPLDTLLGICQKILFEEIKNDRLINLLAFALIHSRCCSRSLVQRCLLELGRIGVGDPGVDTKIRAHSSSGAKSSKDMKRGWRPYGVQDIDPSLLARMALEDVAELARVRDRVLMESTYCWKDAVQDFEVHGHQRS